MGVAPNKFLAKLPSDLSKPDGLLVIEPGTVSAFLAPLPVNRIWGVGKKVEKRLHELGIATIGQLAATPLRDGRRGDRWRNRGRRDGRRRDHRRHRGWWSNRRSDDNSSAWGFFSGFRRLCLALPAGLSARIEGLDLKQLSSSGTWNFSANAASAASRTRAKAKTSSRCFSRWVTSGSMRCGQPGVRAFSSTTTKSYKTWRVV